MKKLKSAAMATGVKLVGSSSSALAETSENPVPIEVTIDTEIEADFCIKCGIPVKGRFCPKCGTRMEKLLASASIATDGKRGVPESSEKAASSEELFKESQTADTAQAEVEPPPTFVTKSSNAEEFLQMLAEDSPTKDRPPRRSRSGSCSSSSNALPMDADVWTEEERTLTCDNTEVHMSQTADAAQLEVGPPPTLGA